jgi:hypothetical protein
MIIHKDICVDSATATVLIDGEGEEILLEIRSILKHALFLVSADNDVIEGAGKFDAGFARHGETIANKRGNVNITALQV